MKKQTMTAVAMAVAVTAAVVAGVSGLFYTVSPGASGGAEGAAKARPAAGGMTEAEYREKVGPLLKEFERENNEALIEALLAVHAGFNQYGAGVPAFCEEMGGFANSTAMACVGAMDWWDGGQRMEAAAGECFCRHVVSDNALVSMVNQVVMRYGMRLAENRDRFLAGVDAVLGVEQVPVSLEDSAPERRKLAVVMAAEARALATKGARLGIRHNILTNAAGEAAWQAVTKTPVVMLVSGALLSTASAILPASAVAVMAATGAAVGSIAGPAGTATGLVASCVAGLVVDCVARKAAKREMEAKTGQWLENVKRTLLEGRPGSTQGGLRAELAGAGDMLVKLADNAARGALLGETARFNTASAD